jgi:hypothetical protein
MFKFKKLFSFFFLIISFVIFDFASSKSEENFTLDTILYHGPNSTRVNYVYICDGYLESQRDKFYEDLQVIHQQIISQSPFSDYLEYFNFYAIFVPSLEEGVSHPQSAQDCDLSLEKKTVNNYFGSSFDAFGIHRLLVPNKQYLAYPILTKLIPDYDQVFFIANSTHYGGSGGSFATSSVNGSAGEIAIHEIGHSFAYLADEYWAGPQYATEKPNLTQEKDSARVRWHNWFDGGEIGLYPHEENPEWFRPHQSCKMRFLGAPFCSVCMENFVERIHSISNPIISYSPTNLELESKIDSSLDFKFDLIQTEKNTVKIAWFLNDTLLKSASDSIVYQKNIAYNQLNQNKNILEALVWDSSPLTRSSIHAQDHSYTTRWEISKNTSGISVESNQLENNLIIYPNPIKDQFTIKIENQDLINQNQLLKLEIFDINGNLIYQDNVVAAHEIQINLADSKFDKSKIAGQSAIVKLSSSTSSSTSSSSNFKHKNHFGKLIFAK